MFINHILDHTHIWPVSIGWIGQKHKNEWQNLQSNHNAQSHQSETIIENQFGSASDHKEHGSKKRFYVNNHRIIEKGVDKKLKTRMKIGEK